MDELAPGAQLPAHVCPAAAVPRHPSLALTVLCLPFLLPACLCTCRRRRTCSGRCGGCAFPHAHTHMGQRPRQPATISVQPTSLDLQGAPAATSAGACGGCRAGGTLMQRQLLSSTRRAHSWRCWPCAGTRSVPSMPREQRANHWSQALCCSTFPPRASRRRNMPPGVRAGDGPRGFG